MGGFVILRNYKESESFTRIEAANLRSEIVVWPLVFGVIAFLLGVLGILAASFLPPNALLDDLFKQGYQFYFVMIVTAVTPAFSLIHEMRKLSRVIDASRARTADQDYRDRLRRAGFQLIDEASTNWNPRQYGDTE